MNNKATLGEQTMVVLFLLNLFLIMAGIVWGVYAFFTQDYEFREADSALLTFHIKAVSYTHLTLPTIYSV